MKRFSRALFVAAFALLGIMVYMLFFKKYKEATKLTQNVKIQ